MTDARSLGPARILLVTARIDRHARELIRAMRERGAQVYTSGLAEIGFDTGSASGLTIPHFGQNLPDAVCVRAMDAGSFEQVTRRLGVLHALAQLGVFVSNDARAIENCVDKSMTSFLLARAGLPSPRSYAVESRAEALRIMAAEAGPMVLKPLFGAQGKGLKLIRADDDLPPADEIAGGVYYLQRFAGVETAGRWSDVRILISGGRAVASMRRQSASWITNVKQGAEPLPMPPDNELETLAIAATAAVGGDFCGVDLLRDAAGRAQIIEVNSMPAWTGLKKATGRDLAAIRAGDLLARIDARRAAGVPRPLSAAE
ncbi:RimK family alpha-L-glutamate ligase [Aurantimonas marianensis]|uniref:RimK family alpha-L-glutamate ligase n=1 Tax=Aurantimonas marianensis TaxID=2920428 RepID=A0A9X2H4H9_9HYPH|nr:RimK family alpha-L-glutamate ligase [Aurantimonas marianensis]MCP3053615.1 RimK family alpha-L-glutamate ligase [Aurantimonas marianensis]